MDADAHQVGGTVRLGTPEAFGTYFLAPRLAELCTAQPALEVELVANPRSFSLSKREADLAIGMTRPETGRLYARKLVDYALGLYAARRYVEAAETIRSVDDLPRHRWVGYVEDLLWTSELNYLPQVSAAIHPQARISNVITQLEAVRGGAGLAVLPHFLARGCQDLVAVLPEVHIVRAYWLIAHADTRDLPRVRLVSDFLTRQAEAAGNAFGWRRRKTRARTIRELPDQLSLDELAALWRSLRPAAWPRSRRRREGTLPCCRGA
ncbi:LysR substrate-binding domain-containing protein [Methylobacterium tardum]|uniref:LysR substrate-binding domain-containing protein n=1 Tax=Methylobacterium tardum TaxID=374432 RepID=UPI00360F3005